MKTTIKKLTSRKGFSLGEMLVALLILGLMTIALAAGINTSQRVYYDSVTYSEKRMLLSTLSDTVRTELRYAKEVKLKDPTNKFTNRYYDAGKQLYVLDTYTSTNYGFKSQIYATDSTLPVVRKLGIADGVSNTYPMIGTGNYSNDKLRANLYPMIDVSKSELGDSGEGLVGYDADAKVFVFTVQVYEKGKDTANAERRTITVKPLEEPEIPSAVGT